MLPELREILAISEKLAEMSGSKSMFGSKRHAKLVSKQCLNLRLCILASLFLRYLVVPPTVVASGILPA